MTAILQNNRDSYLYLLNAALLFTHEIDSAYWHEWELFRLPGGIQAFLVINFLLILLFLIGFRLLVQSRRSGYFFAILLAGSGIFAFAVHSAFLLQGHPAFRLPVSMALLALAFLVSLIEGISAVQALRRSATGGTRT